MAPAREGDMAPRRDGTLADLRERITSGRIPPGSHLTETDLAAEYNLSRSPIRKALRELSAEGLVVLEPRRGAFVAEWTTSDAAEIMEIRALLEGQGARLAAMKRTPEQLQALAELNARMEQLNLDRPDGYRTHISELNHEFHLLILESASAPRLYSIAKDLALAPIMVGSFQFYDDHQLERSLDDHRMILDAIDHHEPERARILMDGHLRNAYAALNRHREAETRQATS